LFPAATGETTAAPGEETTAVPQGKTTKKTMRSRRKYYLIETT